MKFTDQEVRMLEGTNPQRGWMAIPQDCPVEIRGRIIERRAALVGIKPRNVEEEKTVATFDALKSLSL
jgi:hypothetical protein